MKVWILQTGEPLQIDSNGLRPMRAMNLSQALIDKGHHVTLWSSDFDHFSKQHRFGSEKTIEVSAQLTIRLIKSRGYRSNIGISRLIDHFQLGWNLWRMLKKEKAPDLGFVGYPPIEPAWIMINFLKKHSKPSVLDVKDAWPDVLVRGFPHGMRSLARFMLNPYFMVMKSTFKKSSYLSSISPPFLEWSVRIANRSPRSLDKVNYLSVFPLQHEKLERTTAEKFWDSLGILEDNVLRCSYIGSITGALNFERVIEAAKKQDVQFVIAGTGPALSQIQKSTEGMQNIVFPGWLTSAQAAILGFYYSNLVPDSLTELIGRLARDRQNLLVIGQNANNLFNRQFSGEIVYGDMVRTLEEIVEQCQAKF
jgi:glycosyltransferase involved in cell wall biosynthesis